MECKGWAPLTNEIKIFKHCFTILRGPHRLFLLPIRYVEYLTSMSHDSCAITHAQHPSQGRQSPYTWRKYPHLSLPRLIIPAPIITLRTSKTPILLTASKSARLYLFPLFIANTLILPLMISFRTHHVTMKDVGFKSPSLQLPPSQLAFSNQ